MAAGQLNGVVRQIERLFGAGGVTGMSEGQLLERFVSKRDEAAFEALVARHGPMVLGVCRQFLRDPNDVEDAFQATFLVLVRKAATLRDRNLLGNWLYGVAYRVAVRARTVAARRHATETTGIEELAMDRESTHHELRPWLHEEIHRLPEKYRVPVVLCYLEGLTHEEAADQLHWPTGTVKGRLSRARDLLRSRLTRRGLALPTGLLAFNLSGSASAAVPAPLVASTIKAATAVAAGQSAATALLSAQAVALSEGVLSTMLLTKVKGIAATLLVAGAVVTTGAGVFARQAPSEENANAKAPAPVLPEPVVAQPEAVNAKTKASPNQSQPRSNQTPSGTLFKEEGSPGPLDKMGRKPGLKANPGMMGMMGGMTGETDRSLVTQREQKMRVSIAKMAAQLEERDKSPKNAAILRKLDEPITMSFPNETPLEEIIKYIKTATTGSKDSGIPIYIDPVGLNEAEVTLISPIILDLEGVPLKTTLRLLLKQKRLAYCVKDGLLFISSVNGIYQELQEAGIEDPDSEALRKRFQ